MLRAAPQYEANSHHHPRRHHPNGPCRSAQRYCLSPTPNTKPTIPSTPTQTHPSSLSSVAGTRGHILDCGGPAIGLGFASGGRPALGVTFEPSGGRRLSGVSPPAPGRRRVAHLQVGVRRTYASGDALILSPVAIAGPCGPRAPRTSARRVRRDGARPRTPPG